MTYPTSGMTTSPLLPGLGDAVDRIAEQLAQATPGRRSVWRVEGPPASGKTVVALDLLDRLKGSRLLPVLVAPPPGALDMGPIALVQLAVGLKSHGLIDGVTSALVDPGRPWQQKLEDVRGWLDRSSKELVVLYHRQMDRAPGSHDDAHFASRARDVDDLLVRSIDCRRVLLGRERVRHPAAPVERRSPGSRPVAWLRDPAVWGALAGSARQLADEIGSELEGHSPLEVKLLVALHHLSSMDEVRRWLAGGPARRTLSIHLADRLARDESLRGLREAWIRLSHVRRPFGPDLLEEPGTAALDATSRSLLENCLLSRIGCRFALHETLRNDALTRFPLASGLERDAHRTLARYYIGRIRQEGVSVPALEDEMEAFHHATASGDPTLVSEARPFFVDQLDILGRTLSQSGRYAEAVTVFERAIAWDQDDSYAHHYLAFNLDQQGRDPRRVDAHYQRAIEMEPANAWFRSRYISFLIVRGLTREARLEWDRALDALGLPSDDSDPWIYEEFHIWIARLLVHRGQIDFAQEVLDAIPVPVRENNRGLRATDRRLRALLEARRGRAVFPMSLLDDDPWSGPHLSAGLDPADRPLSRWFAGRVEAVGRESIRIRVGERPPGESPVYGWIDLSPTQFDAWCRDSKSPAIRPGQFLEIAYYGDAQEPVIRVHRPSRDPDLPPLGSDPLRYLRTGGWAR